MITNKEVIEEFARDIFLVQSKETGYDIISKSDVIDIGLTVEDLNLKRTLVPITVISETGCKKFYKLYVLESVDDSYSYVFLDWSLFICSGSIDNYLDRGIAMCSKKGDSIKLLPLDLTGSRVVITGTLQGVRQNYIDFIKDHGGKYESAVSKTTDLLIMGDSPGEVKKKKAGELGITVINENEFIVFCDYFCGILKNKKR